MSNLSIITEASAPKAKHDGLRYNPTPGEILLLDFLEPLGLSQYALAKAINVPPRRIKEIVHGKRAVSADTDLRLTHYFGMSSGFFLRLQIAYDLEEVMRAKGDEIAKIIPRPKPDAV